jgi:hypothetical protein
MRDRWRVVAELGCWLVAVWALLSQIACVRNEAIPLGPDTLYLKDATFTPDFAVKRGNDQASLTATVRYWTAPGRSFTVTWPEVRLAPECNRCIEIDCPPRLADPPAVAVFHRASLAAEISEDASFDVLAGCPGSNLGPAVFTPSVTGEYLAHLTFPGLTFPSDPGVWFPISVLSNLFAMPPRLLTPLPGGTSWQWQARRDAGGLKEAFDPRLRVGRVRILLGTCLATPPAPRDDECGTDQLMDPQFTMDGVIAPHYLRVAQQDCRGEVTPNGDGDIDLGVDPSDPAKSRCRSQFRLVFFTPAYLSDETQAGTPVIWKVEFSADDGFPPPEQGRQVWIEFTLVPAP